MRKETTTVLGAMAATALLASACTTVVDDPDPDPSVSDIVQQSTTSECGGFVEVYSGGDSGDAPAYCDAEVLHWTYDAQTQKLFLNDSRIELNCCGEHDMVITEEGGVYVVTETDAPEMHMGQGARCGCTCVFDFAVEAEAIPQGTIQLEVKRHVTDSSTGVQTVFQGSLDLTQQAGWEIIDNTPSTWCGLESSEEPPEEEPPSAS
ncbi:MAG: hypothetical protein JRI68_27645 [Deltaproteobacteria bacterium]|nr:hypothetical protein [Deltaproteobacteria bacterium]